MWRARSPVAVTATATHTGRAPADDGRPSFLVGERGRARAARVDRFLGHVPVKSRRILSAFCRANSRTTSCYRSRTTAFSAFFFPLARSQRRDGATQSRFSHTAAARGGGGPPPHRLFLMEMMGRRYLRDQRLVDIVRSLSRAVVATAAGDTRPDMRILIVAGLPRARPESV